MAMDNPDACVVPLGALKTASSSLPDLHAAAASRSSDVDAAAEEVRQNAHTPTKTVVGADPSMPRDTSTSADTLLLPALHHGTTAPENGASADLVRNDETDRLLPQSSNTAAQSVDEHPAQMIAAALVRQVSIDDAKQRAAAGGKDGVVAAPGLIAGENGLDDDEEEDEEEGDINGDNNGTAPHIAAGVSQPCLVVLGGSLGVAAAYVALEHEDLEFLLIPAWRWMCLGSVTLLCQALSRIFYWIVRWILFHFNHIVDYYTLASELRGAGLLWFRI
eukprot:COSAG02_NODE_16888_length_1047_cov_1.367089_1_plen_275_part_01